MKKITTYVINIKTSIERRNYMMNLLHGIPYINYNFIEAIDGRLFNEHERQKYFDDSLCVSRYGRTLNGGEVGCTLSHFECYKQLQRSRDQYALILEDDISIVREINQKDAEEFDLFMSASDPRILFLSGDYWHLNRRKFTKVFSAVGSYAYLINRAAVDIIMTAIDRPSYVADDWDVYKQLGVKLYAVYPYMIDANIEDIPSDIKQDYWGSHKEKMSRKFLHRAYWNGIVKNLLLHFNLFESKKR